MDLRGNPWSFVNADQSTSIAITSITRNGQGSATVVATAHGHVADDFISIQGTTILGWQKGYRILTALTNSFTIPITPDQFLLANNGANGHVLTLIYRELIDVTQMLWDTPTPADVLSLTDQFGRLVWNPTAPTAGGPLTYMKAFPINGLVINLLPSGTLQISI